MKSVIAIAVVATLGAMFFMGGNSVAVEEQNLQAAFLGYMSEFEKTYTSEQELNYRMSIFKQTLEEINAHNANPESTYEKGLNHLSDWTQEEFNVLLGKGTGANVAEGAKIESVPEADYEPIDHRDEGLVTEVKDQGSCGSCWAFSAVAAMESLELQWNDELELYSEQQLVDCAHEDGSAGCNGGEMTGAFKYYSNTKDHAAHNAALETEYPYHAKNEQCLESVVESSKTHMDGISHHVLVDQDETQEDIYSLHKVLAYRVPSLGVDASGWSSYKSGVFHDKRNNCRLNHGVQGVGWGTEDGTDYVIIKNSWGKRWGEDGFIRIATEDNSSGVRCEISYPEYRC